MAPFTHAYNSFKESLRTTGKTHEIMGETDNFPFSETIYEVEFFIKNLAVKNQFLICRICLTLVINRHYLSRGIAVNSILRLDPELGG